MASIRMNKDVISVLEAKRESKIVRIELESSGEKEIQFNRGKKIRENRIERSYVCVARVTLVEIGKRILIPSHAQAKGFFFFFFSKAESKLYARYMHRLLIRKLLGRNHDIYIYIYICSWGCMIYSG